MCDNRGLASSIRIIGEGKNIGLPISPNQIWKLFNRVRKVHPILEGAVPHGLRANAVIRLRESGHTGQQMSDMVGMSVEMIERYCRHQDKKAAAVQVLRAIREREL